MSSIIPRDPSGELTLFPPDKPDKKAQTAADKINLSQAAANVKNIHGKKVAHPSAQGHSQGENLDDETVHAIVEEMSEELKSAHSHPHQAVDGRALPGKRPYQIKKDILPWMENIFKAGQKGDEFIIQKFRTLIENDAHLSQDVKTEILNKISSAVSGIERQLDQEKSTGMQAPVIASDLSAPLLPDRKLEGELKGLAKTLQGKVHEHLKITAGSLATIAKTVDGVPAETKHALDGLALEMRAEVESIEGAKRFELINEGEEWNPDNQITRYMAFTDPAGNQVLAKSSFNAAGPSYTSQAPRNRNLDNAVVPNFFNTALELKAKGTIENPDSNSSLEESFAATRSAITVEFDQPDAIERAKINEKLLKQVFDAQAGNHLSKMSWEELKLFQNNGQPLPLKLQTVNLLTSDRLRSLMKSNPKLAEMAQKLHHGLSGAPSDDERSLALENLASHAKWDNQVVGYQVTNAETGEKMTIYAKYDLRYFNIPNNILQEKMPEFITFSEELNKANEQSWRKTETDVRAQMQLLGQNLIATTKTLPTQEQEVMSKLMQQRMECTRLREQIMLKTIEGGKFTNDKDFSEWQKRSNQLASLLAEQKTDNVEMQKALRAFESLTKLTDLYLDTRELYKSGLSKKTSNMDNNRSALATRMIALGALTNEIEVHFGCRSGKDRTGLVDIEVKLLLTTSKLTGRMPSYREEERMPRISDYRETMTLESGNTDVIVKANMGASIGINTGGSASQPLEDAEAGRRQQHLEVTEAAEAMSKIASRPNTRWPIKPGYQERFPRAINVKG